VPKCSIITSTRGRPKLLERCIRAIQHQILSDYEHIIVADCCTLTKDVVDKFSDDSRIRYAECKPPYEWNVGARGKNVGIELANGEYICYCDDDNILLPNHCKVLYNAVTKNPEFKDLLFSQFHIIKVPDMASIFKTEPFDISGALELSHNDMLCCIHSKEWMKKIGFWKTADKLNGYGEDGYIIDEFRKHIQLKYHFINIPTAVYYSRLDRIIDRHN
jgi:glycosyltransferase involved in cell wall biosynthesis